MIKVIFDNHGEHTFTDLNDAKYTIIEMVVDEGDIVMEVYNTETNKYYSCVWDVTFQEED